MKLAIQSIVALKNGGYNVVTAPSKVPRECFVFDALDVKGEEVFVAHGILYPVGCAKVRRTAKHVIITWKTEFYATAASLVSMLHEHKYDLDAVLKLLHRRTSEPMRALRQAIERQSRLRKPPARYRPAHYTHIPRMPREAATPAKRTAHTNCMASKVARRVADTPIEGQFGVLAKKDIAKGTTFHFASSDYTFKARVPAGLEVERNTFALNDEDATNDRSKVGVFTCHFGGILQAINSAYGDRRGRTQNIQHLRHHTKNTLYAQALRDISKGEELLLNYKWA
jgi:hypothetical protein